MVNVSPEPRRANAGANGREHEPAPTHRSEEFFRAKWQTRHEERLATRRSVLRWVIRAGAVAFGIALLAPAVALRSLTQAVQAVAAGDLLVYATGDRSGLPIDVAALAPGEALQAFPEGKSDEPRNLIELVRLSEDLPAGLVAYSAICTHLGCSVLPDLTADGNILCPCHASIFDPANGAAVLAGPANRPLPSLPVEVGADGRILATGGFDAPVGPA
jgi:nitrite reductase/ring-hydroxylating ferredoxin subunit